MNNPKEDRSKLEFEWWVDNLTDILATLDTLHEKFPKTFFKDKKKVKPLKIGIHEDIKILFKLKNQSDPESKHQKRLIWAALDLYSQTPEYLQKLSKQLYRIDLNGNRTKRVSDKHVLYAKTQLRLIKQRNELLNSEIDLKDPKLLKLVKTIESQENISVDQFLKLALCLYPKTLNFVLNKKKDE